MYACVHVCAMRCVCYACSVRVRVRVRLWNVLYVEKITPNDTHATTAYPKRTAQQHTHSRTYRTPSLSRCTIPTCSNSMVILRYPVEVCGVCTYTQHNTTQHNTTQHNTTQHNTTQHAHNTTQHNTTQNTTQHNTTQHNTTQQHNTTTQHYTPTTHTQHTHTPHVYHMP